MLSEFSFLVGMRNSVSWRHGWLRFFNEDFRFELQQATIRLDWVMNNKNQKTYHLVDFVISKQKERQVLRLRQRTKKKLWNMKITVMPVVIGALGTISKGVERRLEESEIGGGGSETTQTTAFVREIWGDILSLSSQWKTISQRWERIRPCIPEMTLADYMCQEESGGRGLASIEDSVDTSIQWLEDYIEKREGRLIRATRNNTNDTRISRMIITRKQKWGRNTTLWTF